MAIETVPGADGAAISRAIEAESDALLDALMTIGAASAVVAKLQEDVQHLPGTAGGLADALDVLLGRLRDIVAPAQEAAFDAAGTACKAAA